MLDKQAFQALDPSTSSNRDLKFPACEAYGGEHTLSETLTIGLALTYLDGGSTDIRQSRALRGDLVGDYESNDLHFFAAHVNWR